MIVVLLVIIIVILAWPFILSIVVLIFGSAFVVVYSGWSTIVGIGILLLCLGFVYLVLSYIFNGTSSYEILDRKKIEDTNDLYIDQHGQKWQKKTGIYKKVNTINTITSYDTDSGNIVATNINRGLKSQNIFYLGSGIVIFIITILLFKHLPQPQLEEVAPKTISQIIKKNLKQFATELAASTEYDISILYVEENKDNFYEITFQTPTPDLILKYTGKDRKEYNKQNNFTYTEWDTMFCTPELKSIVIKYDEIFRVDGILVDRLKNSRQAISWCNRYNNSTRDMMIRGARNRTIQNINRIRSM